VTKGEGRSPVIASAAKQSGRCAARRRPQANPLSAAPIALALALRHSATERLFQLRSSPMRNPCVYIMASRRNGTLYTGVTASLERRVLQHREGSGSEFVKRYGCRMLVWYERYERIVDAIAREKQIKAGNRRAKLALIGSMNPDWLDLYETLNQ
jgi:putative endonuclease